MKFKEQVIELTIKEIVNTALNAYISISTASVRPKNSSICVSVTFSCNFSLILLRYKVIFLAGLLAEQAHSVVETLAMSTALCIPSRFINYPVSHIQY